jgi:hypothetical protein
MTFSLYLNDLISPYFYAIIRFVQTIFLSDKENRTPYEVLCTSEG